MRTISKLLALSFLLLTPSVRAEWTLVLSGSIDRVVGNADNVAAVRDGEVWILRDDGSTAPRPLRPRARADGRPREDLGKQAEAILDGFDVSEFDRDTDWAADLVDDERTLAKRRAARQRPLPMATAAPAPLLAASDHALWIRVGQHLLRVDAAGAITRADGRLGEAQTLAAGVDWLLLKGPAGARLLPLQGAGERSVPLPAATMITALDASGGRVAWATPTAIGWTAEGRTTGALQPGAAVRDLAFCGGALVALLADGTLTIPPEGAPAVRRPGPRASRLVCPPTRPQPWLAIAPGLQVSFDAGGHWQPIATPAEVQPTGVALSRHHLWLATQAGLFRTSDGTPGPTPIASSAPPESGPLRQARRSKRGGSWLAWLPKVSVRAAATLATNERALEALASAQFPLDPGRVPVLAATAEEVAAPAPPPAPLRGVTRVVDQRDPDRDCLVRARRRAVELALSEPERARSYLARAGRAAWLPELRVLVSRRYGRSESLDLNSSSTALSSPLGIDTVNDIRYEARATWDLAKLVFSAEELAAQTQALHMAELRRDIENTVNRLYFERRRLILEHGGLAPADQVVHNAELSAELDSLSGGAFGACITSQDGPAGSGD